MQKPKRTTLAPKRFALVASRAYFHRLPPLKLVAFASLYKPADHLELAPRYERENGLLRELSDRHINPSKGQCRNAALQVMLQESLPPYDRFQRIISFLQRQGSFNFRTENWDVRDIDGEEMFLLLLRMADTDAWPMGTNLWTKDHARMARDLRYSSGEIFDADTSLALSHDILLSATQISSTQSQLNRYDGIIRAKDRRHIHQAKNWPHLFLDFNNLNAEKEEAWTHKQQACQWVAYELIEQIEEGLIHTEDLPPKVLQFLGKIVPFLAKICFQRQRYSGHWEEVETHRLSVVALSTQLLDKLQKLSASKGCSFIEEGYNSARSSLPEPYSQLSFKAATDRLIMAGARWCERTLPFESPHHKPGHPERREADAALTDLLDTNFIPFLAKKLGKDEGWVREQESTLLKQLETLIDEKTGGMMRYTLDHPDTYQRDGFYLDSTWFFLNRLYKQPRDQHALDHFAGRNHVLSEGRQAAWSHPMFYVSEWAGRRFLETGDPKMFKLQEQYFYNGLRLLSGENEQTLERGANGMKIVDVPEAKMPEAIITQTVRRRSQLLLSSPNIPLYWAVGAFRRAAAAMERSLQHQRNGSNGAGGRNGNHVNGNGTKNGRTSKILLS